MATSPMDAVRARIRDVPDFPQKGVVFKDITPVLADRVAFRETIDALTARWKGERIDKVVATGGTAEAAGKLVTRQGATLVGYSFLVELTFLHGAKRIGADRVHA